MTPSSRNSGPFAVAPSVPSPHRRGLSRAALRSETFATYGTHGMTATRISGSDPKGGTDVPFIAARTRIRSRPPSPFSSSQFLTYPAIPSPATKPLLTLTCQRQATKHCDLNFVRHGQLPRVVKCFVLPLSRELQCSATLIPPRLHTAVPTWPTTAPCINIHASPIHRQRPTSPIIHYTVDPAYLCIGSADKSNTFTRTA